MDADILHPIKGEGKKGKREEGTKNTEHDWFLFCMTGSKPQLDSVYYSCNKYVVP